MSVVQWINRQVKDFDVVPHKRNRRIPPDLTVMNFLLVLGLIVVGIVFLLPSTPLFISSHIYDGFAALGQPLQNYYGWTPETQWGVAFLIVGFYGLLAISVGTDWLLCTSTFMTAIAHLTIAGLFVWYKPHSIAWFNFCWALQALWILIRCIYANPRIGTRR